MAQEIWHILDVGSIWMKEFSSALSRTVPTVAWSPKMSRLGMLQDWQHPEWLENPRLQVRHFPLQRGYARAPLRWVKPFEGKMLRRMSAESYRPELSPLICSTPFYAPVAERWPGPVIYYSTDLTYAYEGLDAGQVKDLDRRLCRVARAVCPNSRRIADYFIGESGCDPGKITIVPNATRASNLLPEPAFAPGPLPDVIQDLPRPIAGVLGDLSGNMDWVLIEHAVRQTPQLSWLFVGPTTRPIADPEQSSARDRVAQGRSRFVGAKPYSELQNYARALDVAVLPYRQKEPTYSGSSTRFYEHLAAGRPMVATRGFAELLEKEPLLCLVDTAEELAETLGRMRTLNFCDGFEVARWEASQAGTWEERARTLRSALEQPESSETSPIKKNTGVPLPA